MHAEVDEGHDEDSELEQIEAHLATTWYIDSGASKHIAGDSRALTHFRTIEIADGKAYPMTGTSEEHVPSSIGEIKFQKVLYVPGIQENLLSVGKITDQNFGVYFDASHFYILKPPDLRSLGPILAIGTRDHSNGLYKLSTSTEELHLTTHANQSELWHERLGHLHVQSIIRMSRQQTVKGVPPDLSFSNSHVCSACQAGKQSRQPKPHRATYRASKKFELVHRTYAALYLLTPYWVQSIFLHLPMIIVAFAGCIS